MTSPAPLRPMPPPFEWAGDSLMRAYFTWHEGCT